MDVRSGDVLAMVSSPAFDPNDFAQGISQDKWQKIQELTAEKNRATYENYAPGSIFKTVVALAALENGLNPNEIYDVQPDPTRPGKGCIYVGRRKIDDTAPPGDYDFKRAFIHSSNSYFVNAGLRAPASKTSSASAKKFHLGERTGLFAAAGNARKFSDRRREIHSGWTRRRHGERLHRPGRSGRDADSDGRAYSAIANGGTVLWPRLVERIEPQDPASGEVATNFPSGVVRDKLACIRAA